MHNELPDILQEVQLSQRDRATLYVTVNVLQTKVGAQCDKLVTVELKLGTHYPCSRTADTAVILDTRLHGRRHGPLIRVDVPWRKKHKKID